MATIWTSDEDEELLKALQDTIEPTFTARCKGLEDIHWHERSARSIEARARALGYNKVLDYDTNSHSMTKLLTENKRLTDEIEELTKFRAVLNEMVDRAVMKLKPVSIDVPQPKMTSTTRHAYWLTLCDWQSGSAYTKADLGGRGEFNSKLMVKAVDTLTHKFFGLHEYIIKAWASERIVINILGDMVEGVDIYRGQRAYIDMQRMTDQCFFVEELLFQFIARIAQVFPYVSVNCVQGNHGRISKDHHELDNWDYWVYRMIQRRFEQITSVKVNISESHAMLYQIVGHPKFLHLISHGEEIRSAAFNIPYYNMDKWAGQYSNLAGRIINYVTIAHHHRMARAEMPAGEWLICPPLIGTTAFSVKAMGTTKRGAQMLSIFHPDTGLVFPMPLYTTELEPLRANEDGILTPTYSPEADRKRLFGDSDRSQ